MDFKKIFFPIRKWWWLVLASTLVAALLSFLYLYRQPKMYQTQTTLMLGAAITNPNPSYNDFILGQQLADAYADITNRQVIREATMKALNLDFLPPYRANVEPNSQLIEIVVNDTDPGRAQAVANELANQLVILSPTTTHSDELGRQEFINQRLNSLETQMQDTEDEIKQLQDELGTVISAQQINEIRGQITSLQSKLSDMQFNYGTLLSNTSEGAVNSFTIIEQAALPLSPIGPGLGLAVLLAAFAGFSLAVGEAYLLEYLNDTLKSSDDVSKMFSAPVIGHIFEIKNGQPGNHLVNPADMQQPMAEAFRVLRTNIELSNSSQSLKSILITSVDVGDGKTFVAANLAKFIAQRKKKVVLLDADLRRPTLHTYFDLDNEKGLIDVITNNASIREVLNIQEDRKLAVITAGEPSLNPSEFLSSNRMNQLMAKLRGVVDYIIIDSPPFIISDTMILAAKVDGIVMVVRPGHTRQPLAQVAKDQISQVGAHLIGVVLNRIPVRNAVYYAGKGHLYTHYMSDYGKAPKPEPEQDIWEVEKTQ